MEKGKEKRLAIVGTRKQAFYNNRCKKQLYPTDIV